MALPGRAIYAAVPVVLVAMGFLWYLNRRKKEDSEEDAPSVDLKGNQTAPKVTAKTEEANSIVSDSAITEKDTECNCEEKEQSGKSGPVSNTHVSVLKASNQPMSECNTITDNDYSAADAFRDSQNESSSSDSPMPNSQSDHQNVISDNKDIEIPCEAPSSASDSNNSNSSMPWSESQEPENDNTTEPLHVQVSQSEDSVVLASQSEDSIALASQSEESNLQASESEDNIVPSQSEESIQESNIVSEVMEMTSNAPQGMVNGHKTSPRSDQSTESPTDQLTGCSQSDTNSEASNDSGKGGSITNKNEVMVYEFEFPQDLCGMLIGRNGRNISAIKQKSKTEITLRRQPGIACQLCSIEGTKEGVDYALTLIRRKFPKTQFPNLDLTQIKLPLESSPVVSPESMQLILPESVTVDSIVSSIVDAGHIFVQQPTHPTFTSLERLNQFMIMCYNQDGIVPQLPRPVEVGVICAAPMMNGWYRAQVMYAYENDECDIKYVDYGGFSRVQASCLRQIRSDFMSLPFQACECYMANIAPLSDEAGFSLESGVVLEELVQGRMVQVRSVGMAEDGLPYVQLYTMEGGSGMLVNRELVNRGVVRWMELQA